MADTFNHRIRRIDTDGTITTIAGTGSETYNGDGIAATSASLSMPHDVTVSRRGVVFIADSGPPPDPPGRSRRHHHHRGRHRPRRLDG